MKISYAVAVFIGLVASHEPVFTLEDIQANFGPSTAIAHRTNGEIHHLQVQFVDDIIAAILAFFEEIWCAITGCTPSSQKPKDDGTNGGSKIDGTAGDDGVINSPNGLGGPAPCLENYIIVQETEATGADPHAVHGIQANDGAFVAVGSGKQKGENFDNGTGVDGIVIKGSHGCTHPNVYSGYVASGAGGTACQTYAWITKLSTTNKVTKTQWVAESPDFSYYAVAGIEENASEAFSRIALWKINANDGSVAWKMIMGATGSGSGLESIYFTSDGGVVVGGYVEATGPIGDMVFKSSGIITEAKPFIAKVSASDMAGNTTPNSWVWSHTETDATYKGSTKSLRIDSSDNIYANVGTRTSVLKIQGSDGAIVWRSGQIDAAVQSNDLELLPDNSMVLIGHQFGSTMTGCVGTGCSVIKGAMIQLNADGTKAWGPKLYGNYPGGVN